MTLTFVNEREVRGKWAGGQPNGWEGDLQYKNNAFWGKFNGSPRQYMKFEGRCISENEAEGLMLETEGQAYSFSLQK